MTTIMIVVVVALLAALVPRRRRRRPPEPVISLAVTREGIWVQSFRLSEASAIRGALAELGAGPLMKVSLDVENGSDEAEVEYVLSELRCFGVRHLSLSREILADEGTSSR